MAGNWKFGCCCTGETPCAICNPEMTDTGVYVAGQQIGTSCLVVDTGVVTASPGMLSLGATTQIRTNVLPPDGARKYITASYDATSTNRIRFGEKNNWVEVYRDASLGKWIVGLCAGGEINTGTAYQKTQHTGSTSITELLIEICFQYTSLGTREMRVNVPFFNLQTSIPCGEPTYDYSWLRAHVGALVLKHFETWKHISATDGCKQCPVEADDTPCSNFCSDGPMPATILVTMPTFSEHDPSNTDYRCPTNNVSCNKMAGTYRLFLEYDTSESMCRYRVDAPPGCFAIDDSTGVVVPVSHISVYFGLPGGPSLLPGFIVKYVISGRFRFIDGTYSFNPAVWQATWYKAYSGGETPPMTCVGRTINVPFESMFTYVLAPGFPMPNYCKPSLSSSVVITL